MSASTLLGFALASYVLVVAPGPSVLFVIGRALAYGRRAALATLLGNAVGVYVLALLVAFGLGPLLQASETLLTVVKAVGAAYLIVLGVRAFRSGSAHVPAGDEEAAPTGFLKLAREGFTVGFLNPKALVFFSAVLPQFVDPSGGAVSGQIAVLGLVFSVVAMLSDSCYALLAGTARGWFAKDENRLRRVQRAGGGMMALLGGGLLVETARS